MEGKDEVKLHGMWVSTYSKRVELALKIKGIPYEYIEEDLSNKSQLLLEYNPVHKKVPVLVHNGKPLAESHVILEYIDETWKTAPKLLPEDPYERAKVRFWASFIQQQLYDNILKVVISHGEAQEKAVAEVIEKQGVFEEGMKEYFAGGASFAHGENCGLLDVLVATTYGAYEIHEEVLGIRTMDADRNPLLFKWVATLKEHPSLKELLPPRDKLVEFMRFVRQTLYAREV